MLVAKLSPIMPEALSSLRIAIFTEGSSSRIATRKERAAVAMMPS
jgi:hypothetical protein